MADEIQYDAGIAIPDAAHMVFDANRHKGRNKKPNIITSKELMARKTVKEVKEAPRRFTELPTKNTAPTDFDPLSGGLPPEPMAEGPEPEFKANLHASVPNQLTPVYPGITDNLLGPPRPMPASFQEPPCRFGPPQSTPVILGLQDGDMHLLAVAVLTCPMGVTILIEQKTGAPYFVPKPGSAVKLTWNDKTRDTFCPGITFSLGGNLGIVFIYAAEEP